MFLDADDDLSTVRSKLEASSAEELYLVIPRRSSVLRTPLEFRILARIANELSSETIVVSDDGARRRLAEHEGFRTKPSLRTLKHLMYGPQQRRPLLVVPDWIPIPRASTLLMTLLVAGVSSLVLGVALPVLRVTLVPQTTEVTRELELAVDPAARTADPAQGILPGEVLTQRLEVAGSLPIPADRTLGKDRARGELVVISRRTEQVTLPRGTVARVPDGPQFTTDQEVRLPPGVPVRIGVTAASPGSEGNVEARQIAALEGPGLDQIEVSNQRATSGGTDRQARVVAEEDRARLREQLLARARDQGRTELRARSGADRSLPEETLRIRVDSEQFDQAPGAESEQLTGRLIVTATATAFVNTRFNELVGQMLVRSAASDVQLSGSPDIQPPAVVRTDGQKVVLRTRARGLLLQDIDREAIAQALQGKTVPEARAYVARLSGLAQPPRLEVSPEWAPRAFRVEVAVQRPK